MKSTPVFVEIIQSGEEISKSALGSLGAVGALFAILIVIAFFVVIVFTSKRRSGILGRVFGFIEDHLTIIFVLAWIYGFVTYYVGTYVGDVNGDRLWSILSGIPMAMIHATEMFVGMSDISAIHEDRHESVAFMIMFDTSHFIAVCVSLCFVFKHLGYYMIAKFKVLKESFFGGSHSNLYVFWGVCDQAMTLAQSTINHYLKNSDNDYLIIFVKSPSEERSEDQRIGFDRFFNFVTMKEREMKGLSRMENSIVVSSYHKLSELELSQGHMSVDILKNDLRMKTLIKLLNRSSHIHIFFLGDERDSNINATINIVRESSFANKKVDIYCQARKNSKAEWMEYYSLLNGDENKKIHIVDASILSVNYLKSNVNFHPISFADWQGNRMHPDSFTSLVIGFHDTGMEALKFLYEFGTFTDDNGHRIPCKYVVMDRELSSYEGGFYAKAPALVGNDEIRLVKCAVNDKMYWKNIDDLLPNLNYVVISVGDDDSGINAAADICRMAYRCKKRSKDCKLRVFVKSYDMDNLKRITEVKDSINSMCKERNIGIEIFGTTDEMFSYDLIINDKLLRNAMVYNYYYEQENKRLDGKVIKLPTLQELYNDDSLLEKYWRETLKLDKVEKNPSMENIGEAGRKMSQNLSNSLHAYTKIKIIEKHNSLTDYPNSMHLYLAQLEHERWVAYCKITGWQQLPYDKDNPDCTRDELHKLHVDICPWEKIHDIEPNAHRLSHTQMYDWAVVTTTVNLELARRS